MFAGHRSQRKSTLEWDTVRLHTLLINSLSYLTHTTARLSFLWKVTCISTLEISAVYTTKPVWTSSQLRISVTAFQAKQAWRVGLVFWRYLVRTKTEKWHIQTGKVSHCLNIFDTITLMSILEVLGSNKVQDTQITWFLDFVCRSYSKKNTKKIQCFGN